MSYVYQRAEEMAHGYTLKMKLSEIVCETKKHFLKNLRKFLVFFCNFRNRNKKKIKKFLILNKIFLKEENQ